MWPLRTLKIAIFFTQVQCVLSLSCTQAPHPIFPNPWHFSSSAFGTERSVVNKWGISSFRGAGSAPFHAVCSCQSWERKPLVQQGSDWEHLNWLLIGNQQKEHTLALHSLVIQLIHDKYSHLHFYLSYL